MTQPSTKTIKRLFGLSGNKCCFPKCSINLIDKTTNQVIGEICHIKSRRPGGPRYDPNQSDDERNDFENLILLCPNHHNVIDSDEESYNVERLQQIKKDHELKIETPDLLSDELAEKFLVRNEIILNADNNINNAINSQFANIIQNFNNPIEINTLTTYNDLFTKIHSGQESLSKNLADALKIAQRKWDEELENLCISELSGWDSSKRPMNSYRFQPVYISPYKITRVTNLSMFEFWRDLENKPNQFVYKEMFFANSVSDIEYNVDINKYNDPSKFYIHLTKKQAELFPGLENPDLEINIYCRGTLYHDLIKGIKTNLAKEILKRLK